MIWIGKRIKNHIAEITVDHIVLDPEITFIETISTLESQKEKYREKNIQVTHQAQGPVHHQVQTQAHQILLPVISQKADLLE